MNWKNLLSPHRLEKEQNNCETSNPKSENWKNLLSPHRLGKGKNNCETSDSRTEFTRDWDRIIFSSAFRRLQDKTQVFPLAKNDYIRTRLTHSLEVASVGRSLGILAGKKIKCEFSEEDRSTIHDDIGSIVSAACLAHDIGNPPFGHAGEAAIQEFFERNGELLNGLTDEQRNDFKKFEGNAQGFRLLTNPKNSSQRNGMQLTSAVLGAFMKYPCPSTESKIKGISSKKFGFMQSEKEIFLSLAADLGLKKKTKVLPEKEKKESTNISEIGNENTLAYYYRHPLAFLVEAADDICYHIMDIEDGFKTGVVSIDELIELHYPWLVCGDIDKAKKLPIEQKAEFFRAKTINKVTREIADIFESNFNDIKSGNYDKELISDLTKSEEFSNFKKLAVKKVYSTKAVVEIEACGFKVIDGLLSIFIDAIKSEYGDGKSTASSRTLCQLLPKTISDPNNISPYKQLLMATDFISGMTDTYAVSLYQRISGISLP